jgi:type IV secretory pathway VirB10-like protein
MSTSSDGNKKAISRKMIGWVFIGLAILTVLSIVVALIKDPAEERKQKKQASAEESLEKLTPGTSQDAQRQIDDLKKKLMAQQARAVKQEARERAKYEEQALEEFGGESTSFLPGAPGESKSKGGGKGASADQVDPEMLRMLREASEEANQGPALADLLKTGGAATADGEEARKRGGSGIVYDSYGKGVVAKALGESSDDDLFGGSDKGSDASSTGVYEANRPLDPPDRLLVSQGTLLPAQLITAIDTRNSGQITAIVSRTIYDSFTHSTPLIPQGSKLIGTYSPIVSAGTSRLAMTFTRIILPNGRAINIGDANVSSQDGTMGIKGNYHSNLMRMVGPAFAVAALGQWVDTIVDKEDSNEGSDSNGSYYSKGTVIEQTMPTITSAIQQRYSNANPYMTLKPGQDIRLVLSQDLQFALRDGEGLTR